MPYHPHAPNRTTCSTHAIGTTGPWRGRARRVAPYHANRAASSAASSPAPRSWRRAGCRLRIRSQFPRIVNDSPSSLALHTTFITISSDGRARCDDEDMYNVREKSVVPVEARRTNEGVGSNVPKVTNFPARPGGPPFRQGRRGAHNGCRVTEGNLRASRMP